MPEIDFGDPFRAKRKPAQAKPPEAPPTNAPSAPAPSAPPQPPAPTTPAASTGPSAVAPSPSPPVAPPGTAAAPRPAPRKSPFPPPWEDIGQKQPDVAQPPERLVHEQRTAHGAGATSVPRVPSFPAGLLTGRVKQPAPEARPLEEELQGAFERSSLPPPLTSLSYHAGMALAAAVLLVLAAAYVALIGAVGWFVYHHATTYTVAKGAQTVWPYVIYWAPLVAGPLVLLSLLKPFLAPASTASVARPVKPEEEPILFGFLAKLCQTIHAPVPAEVRVDHQVNAYAGLARGLFSFWRKHLVLTVGLPMAAGLTVEQFTGVLAHELGHFSQSGGMRLRFLVLLISEWFHRGATQQDAWDAWLARAGPLLLPIRLPMLLSRLVLWLLRGIGLLTCGLITRQMEYDADLWEIRLVGSSPFAATMRRVLVLDLAQEYAFRDLDRSLDDGRLADDFTALVLLAEKKIDPEVLRKVRHLSETQGTGPLDSHPSNRDRIDAALRLEYPGVFESKRPAQCLFKGFAKLSRAVSYDFYRLALGPGFYRVKLVATDELAARLGEEEKKDKASLRYFQGLLLLWRPMRLPQTLSSPSGPLDGSALEAARKAFLDGLPRYREVLAGFSAADDEFLRTNVAETLARTGLPFDLSSLGVGNRALASMLRGQALESRDGWERRLGDGEALAWRRMELGLSMLHSEAVDASLPAAPALREDVARMLPVCRLLSNLVPELWRLRDQWQALRFLAGWFNQAGLDPESAACVRSVLETRTRHMHEMISGLRAALAETPYPFDHASGPMSLSKYLLRSLPDSEDLGAVLQAGADIQQGFQMVYFRALGVLALAAEELEGAMGLKPLSLPKEG